MPQLPQPALHASTWQGRCYKWASRWPACDVVARPQLPMLVLVLVSRPLPVLPSQS